jgi:hypothetical protein
VLSNKELTAELNKAERQLNKHGYSLRKKEKVKIREHKPDRALLATQVRSIRKQTAAIKATKARISPKQLRNRVRREAVPVEKIRSLKLSPHNQFFVSPADEPLEASSHFGWAPKMGEPDLAEAFLETNATFRGSTSGLDPGLRGEFVAKAGAYVLDDRYEAARLTARFESDLKGSHDAEIKVSVLGGYEYPILREHSDQPIELSKRVPLFADEYEYWAMVYVVGYPVEVTLTVSPEMDVRYNVELEGGRVFAHVTPHFRLDATLEAYVSAIIASAGAGGRATLLDVKPVVYGSAYLTERDGIPELRTWLFANIRARFLEGSLYAFVRVGIWPFRADFEWELLDYEGWSYTLPVYEFDSVRASNATG